MMMSYVARLPPTLPAFAAGGLLCLVGGVLQATHPLPPPHAEAVRATLRSCGVEDGGRRCTFALAGGDEVVELLVEDGPPAAPGALTLYYDGPAPRVVYLSRYPRASVARPVSAALLALGLAVLAVGAWLATRRRVTQKGV